MPPTGPLGGDELEALTRWVAMGAPWPEASVPAAGTDPPDPSPSFDLPERRRTHWASHPVQAGEPPAVDDAWTATPGDRFILAALDEAGLAPAAHADHAALIRRLSFDLRGLPPTPAEIARFAGDDSPAAYADVVDRYLAPSHFDERWARHWMDLFRYSESHGSEGDPDIPFAWRYRDYLIRAFNDDVPYDRLIREHLAGDLLPEPRLDLDGRTNESMIGPANFRLVEHGYQPVDPWEDRVKWTDNQVDVASKASLGLTVSCARCHDQKFDAISQKDYYSFFGTLYGARPTLRAIDSLAPLETNRDALAALKADIRGALPDAWSAAAESVGAELLAALEPEARDAEGREDPEGREDGEETAAASGARPGERQRPRGVGCTLPGRGRIPARVERAARALARRDRRPPALQRRALRAGVRSERSRLRRDGRPRDRPHGSSLEARRARHPPPRRPPAERASTPGPGGLWRAGARRDYLTN